MRAILQRAIRAGVSVEEKKISHIGSGLLILLGIAKGDSFKEVDYLVEKCARLRIFCDDQDKMNLSVLDIAGEVLLVSNFTLYADCAKGRRPDFTAAAPPQEAKALYEHFVDGLKALGLRVVTGEFGAHMQVSLEGNGPVTIVLDTDTIMPHKEEKRKL